MEKTIKDYTIELNGLIIGFVRDYITKTKSRYKLTDEEISNIRILAVIFLRVLFQQYTL